ncbi:amino acid adenylation domain-containing protein [Trichocoleus sp. FACHB-591]|uniref:non-ribosomal peptide synthetase n=1 Tax=Trichocoleus sp. FACHB-591 TaxID=2692872 RepID=UPI001688518E|nr:amino acid adenylation domain-containing protein [Trichocoleus sp. FACHB-591]
MVASNSQEELFVFPASFAQQRLWFLHQLVPENPFYNVSAAIRLQGNLHIGSLEQTLQEIGQRHEVLRTTFAVVEGELAQIISPNFHLPLPIVDLQATSAIARTEAAQRIAQEVSRRSFDLRMGPLFQAQLLQLEAADYILLLNFHHIVADGWSIAVLIRELTTLYPAFLKRQPSPLPELPIQYADFAHWQREYLQGEVLASQLSYWRQQLQDLPELQLPTDYPRPVTPSYRGSAQQLELSPELTSAVESLSDRAGVSLFMTLLAAFQTLLYRYTGQTDIVVGSAIANRNRTELEDLIGFFVNSLVLRIDLSGNPMFDELLERVRQMTLAAYAHQEVPFEKLVEELQPERDLSRNPLFQVVFTLQNTPVAKLEFPGLVLSNLPVETETARVDLEFHVYKSLNRLTCTAIYSTDLFEPATMTRLLGHFQTLLTGIVADPKQQIAHLSILSARERDQLFQEWSQTVTHEVAPLCAHQWFEAQVRQTPEAVALTYQNQRLTYRALNQRANQLAHYLQELDVGAEVLVGLCVDRSPEMVISLLAIWKAGGAYLPLDPGYPRDRLQFMLVDAEVKILVTQSSHLHLFDSELLQVVCLDQAQRAIAQQSQANLINWITTNNLAYVIYTSGSTGQPKGVLVEHRGLSNLVQAQRQIFHPKLGSRILQFASLSFDAAIFEILMALTNGATLYLAPQTSLLPGADLLQFLRHNAITHATLPPSVLSVLPAEPLPALPVLISAGEACSSSIVKRWARGRQFFNAYGPTEATIWATVAELTVDSAKPTIGRPIANTQIYILDAHLQPVPVGVAGELYIAGIGVARGYLNRPDLTAERFVSLSLPSAETLAANTPLYKTGDRARYLPDGNVEFLGRADTQVKLRGFRVELGEIEAVLQQHDAVQVAVAIASQDKQGEQRLVAYVIPHEQQSVTDSELREFLQSRLPSYLIPATFVLLETLPLTPNGKVDRAALPMPELADLRLGESMTAPRTLLEKKLANIWAEVLHLEQVGIDENFFALGGDSFLALRLMEQVQQQFGQSLPLSMLFLAPTVEQLAKQLSSPDSLDWSPLVPLQPAGTKPPFFCIHPVMGMVLPYAELARRMGTEQPFYGLQPFGLDGQQPPLKSIEQMASHYIQAIRAVQPRGPYYLGGWSFGGLVAFEMAQQLRQAGHEVALLALLDTLAPIPTNQPSFGESWRFLITTVLKSLPSFGLDYFRLLIASLSETFWKRRSRLNQIRSKTLRAAPSRLPPDSQLRLLKELALSPMLRIFYANSQAVRRYIPRIYSGPITLFKSSQFKSSKPLSQAKDDFLGWHSLTTTKIKTHVIPGDHFSILKQPHVQVLAEQLRTYFK